MSTAEELSKLFELKKQGILTEDEFNKEKSKLIGMPPFATPIYQGVPSEQESPTVSQASGSAKPKSASQRFEDIKKDLSGIKQEIDHKVAKLERSENENDQDYASELEDISSEIESALDTLNNIENFTI